MNVFQKVVILGEMNRPALALLNCHNAENVLKDFNNYQRLTDIDLFEANCLILLGEQEEAQTRLNTILNLKNNEMCSNTSSMIQSLAYSLILDRKYQDCVEIMHSSQCNLLEGTQWFLAFCLYKLNKIDACKENIENTLIYANKKNKHFLLALRYRIEKEDSKFLKECRCYYYVILNEMDYNTVPIILNLLLEFAEEKENDELRLKVFSDLNCYHEKRLNLKRSNLLE